MWPHVSVRSFSPLAGLLILAAAAVAQSLVLPPIAATNGDQSSATGTTVVLDGTSSSDPQGLPLTYSWRLAGAPAGSLARIFGANTSVASITPDLPGAYFVELTVANSSASNTTAVRVQVTGPALLQRPVAIIKGPAQAALGETITFDGSTSTSPSGLTLSYLWKETFGVPVPVSGAIGPQVSFRSLSPGFVTLELVVSDGTASSLPSTATVVILNVPPPVPVVDAGPSLLASTGQKITLAGTLLAPRGPRSVILQWTYLGGPVLNLSMMDRSTTHPSFTPLVPGVYAFGFAAYDGQTKAESSTAVTVVGENLQPTGASSSGCGLTGPSSLGGADCALFALLLGTMATRRARRGSR